jgi:hypothetical protein
MTSWGHKSKDEVIQAAATRITMLEVENAKLREALTWYAFTEQDLTEQTSADIWDNPNMLATQLFDYGKKAREALER